jgi:hypothetical protein
MTWYNAFNEGDMVKLVLSGKEAEGAFVPAGDAGVVINEVLASPGGQPTRTRKTFYPWTFVHRMDLLADPRETPS